MLDSSVIWKMENQLSLRVILDNIHNVLLMKLKSLQHSCFNIVVQEKERKKQETIGAREQDVALAFTKEVELQSLMKCPGVVHCQFRRLTITLICSHKDNNGWTKMNMTDFQLSNNQMQTIVGNLNHTTHSLAAIGSSYTSIASVISLARAQ